MIENVLANYGYVGLMALVTLFLTPIYVRLMGPSEWGAVALCITFQSLLFLLDAGLGQVAPREFAALRDDPSALRALYRRFQAIYLTGGLLTWVVGQALLGWLMPLLSPDVSDSGMWAARLILTQFALTFANSAPLGLWNGLQMQKRVNLRQAGFMAIKHAGALICLTALAPTAWSYVLPFVVVGAFETAFNLWTVRREHMQGGSAQRAAEMAPAPAFTALLSSVGGFGLAVLAGMLTSQVDRLFLAAHLNISDFGAYSLAVTLGLAFMNLQHPLQKAFLPRVVTDQGAAKVLFVAVSLVCVVPCFVVAAWSEEVLNLWVGPMAMTKDSPAVLSLVLVGVAFNALYSADYTRLVALRAWRPVLAINMVILCFQWAVLTWCADALGMRVGGWSWVICGVTQFLLGRMWFLHKGSKRD